MAIKELAEDLMLKLKSVPALNNNVGMASAGRALDPTMKNAPLPSAWLLFEGDSPQGGDFQLVSADDIIYNFTAAVMVSYKDQADVLNNQLPFLEELARSVSGRDSLAYASRWKYQGAQLVDIFDDRLVYELSFSVSAAYTL